MPIYGMLHSLDAYPHWLVVTCEALAAVVVLWVLLKLLKLALWILFFGIVVIALVSVASFFFQ
jgi:hypothetical protein